MSPKAYEKKVATLIATGLTRSDAQAVVDAEELGGKKVKAEQVPAATRITNQLKSAALRGKVSTDELAAIAELANALKVFIK